MSSAKTVKPTTSTTAATTKPAAKSEPVKQTATTTPAKTVSEPAPAAAPKAVKSTKKETAPAPAAPVVAPTPVPAPVPAVESKSAPPSSTEEESGSVSESFTAFSARLNDVVKMMKDLSTELKQLQKQVAKEQKTLSKSKGRKGKGKRQGGAPRSPSGFAKPCALSKDLCEFLGVDASTQLARTEVTKRVTSYVKDHNLQDQSNKKRILPDAKLQKLLNVPKDKNLEFFNLQTFLKHHYPKTDVPATPAVAAPVKA